MTLQLKPYGKGNLVTYRTPANIDEMAQHCSANAHIWFHGNQGDARRCKVNGTVRRWKRDSNRIEVPVKYGLYEYATLTARDIDRVLIPDPWHGLVAQDTTTNTSA